MRTSALPSVLAAGLLAAAATAGAGTAARAGGGASGIAVTAPVADAEGAPAGVDAPDRGAVALQAREIAPGAWHVGGAQAVWGAGHRGAVANAGFVVGRRCVAVIDTGGSPTVGRALLASVRRASALPVCYVINTHAHPDHVFGNEAFDGAGPEGRAPRVVGHARLPAAMAAREAYYVKALQRDFEPADRTDRLVRPTLLVDDRRELDLGARTLELRAWPTAHTDNDLTVLDRATGTLWLGDLAFAGHLPVLDGKLDGWLSVLQALRALPAARAVPGHGPVMDDWPGALAPTAAYLQQLKDDVRAALRSGASLAETVERLGRPAPPALAGWALVEDYHPRNVTAAYAELEWSE